MKKSDSKGFPEWVTARTVGIIALCIIAAELQVALFYLSGSVSKLRTDMENTHAELVAFVASSTQEREDIDSRIVELSDGLYNQQKQVTDLVETFEDVEGDVSKLSGSVGKLEKLTTTDPELLQKYSKIYFLNENYMPSDLEHIDEKYDYVNGKEVVVHADMLPFLEDLLDDATDDGIDISVLSGYRSFAEQMTLKQEYSTRYGSGANAFSADQGYSEHQLGTTIDFTTNALGENLDAFGTSPAFTWLKRSAYKYGFVLSYPENNEYYVYEPWHWRFVGKDLARYLNRKGKNFYDMEQRDIDEYLATLFDD